MALKGGHIDIVQLFLQHKTSINTLAFDLTELLLCATRENRINIIYLFLDNGTPINALGEYSSVL